MRSLFIFLALCVPACSGEAQPQLGSVELHESVIEDGVARMVALDELALQPGATVQFAPGGKHLMLMRPGDDLVSVTLEFHAGDTVVLRVSVTPTG